MEIKCNEEQKQIIIEELSKFKGCVFLGITACLNSNRAGKGSCKECIENSIKWR